MSGSPSVLLFPLCFFLVAVPWPTLIEGPLIQALTRATASVTVEVLSLFGVPALQHGNIIEVSTGPVGIDDACSGIRSFQASLMIALFLGQVFRLTVSRRWLCVAAGFALSFVFNVGRTVVLTYVASAKGVSAIKSWHDPAGVTIVVGCFLGLWAVAEMLRKRQGVLRTADGPRPQRVDEGLTAQGSGVVVCGPPAASEGPLAVRQNSEDPEASTHVSSFSSSSSIAAVSSPSVSGLRFQVSGFRFARESLVPGLLLITWLVFVEVGVEGWYRWSERRMPPPVTWNVRLPESAPGFQRSPIAERSRRILRFDEALNAAWTGPMNSRWQAIFLRWNPGRTAVHLAKNHTPEICLSSAGRTVVLESEIRWCEAAGLRLPFRVYEVTDPMGLLHVFYCLWDDRGTAQGVETMMLTYENRMAPVLAGRRQAGQRSLEVAIAGCPDTAEAERIFRKALPQIVVLD